MMMFDRLRDRHPGESVASDCNALGTPLSIGLFRADGLQIIPITSVKHLNGMGLELAPAGMFRHQRCTIAKAGASSRLRQSNGLHGPLNEENVKECVF